MASTPSGCEGASAILSAAARLFAERGYDSVSIADIAGLAGVSKANVFHHFLSKEGLYFEVMRKASLDQAIYAEELTHRPGSFADKVAAFIDFQMRWMFEDECRTWLLMRESAERGHSRARRLGQQVFQRNFTAVVQIFEEARRRGEFSEQIDPAAAAMLLFGATTLFFRSRDVLHEVREMRELNDPRIYAERICGLILGGVLGAAARPRRLSSRNRNLNAVRRSGKVGIAVTESAPRSKAIHKNNRKTRARVSP
jgi:TetR/AcrR family transcriptional regulator